MTKTVFEKLSHIVYEEKSENKSIKRIPKGTEYYQVWGFKKIPEDAKYRCDIRMSLHGFPYVAREDRWESLGGDYFRTVEEVVDDLDGEVMYDESDGKFYNKPWLEIHYLDGSTSKHFFDTDSDMTDALEALKEMSMEKPNTVYVGD